MDAEEISLGDEVEFVVPTGNFGDVLAGYYAYRMGLPVKKFIIASNANNVLTDFFNTGSVQRKARLLQNDVAVYGHSRIEQS